MFCFLARASSLLLRPWCIMIERGDTTRYAVSSSEPSEDVKEQKKRNVVINNVGSIT